MSYAGVESEYDYQMRKHRESVHSANRYWVERDPEYIKAKAVRDNARLLERARQQLDKHLAGVRLCRSEVRRLEALKVHPVRHLPAQLATGYCGACSTETQLVPWPCEHAS